MTIAFALHSVLGGKKMDGCTDRIPGSIVLKREDFGR